MTATALLTGKERARAAKAAMYTDLVLSAAERVFAAQGYDATKVQAIAREAGISLATLYATFPGKAEIWRKVHERHLVHLAPSESPVALPDDPDTYLDGLLYGVARYLRYLLEHPDYLRLHLMDGHAWALGAGAASTDLQVRAWDAGRGYMADTIRHGIGLGVLVDDDPDLLGQVMVGMHQVRLAHWVVNGMTASHDDVLRGVLRHTVRAFCVPACVPAALERIR